MEEYYQKLLKNLPSKYKQMLIDDQNNWLKWQKQHYKFLNTFMARKNDDGLAYGNFGYLTFYQIEADIYQSRVMDLKILNPGFNH